MVVVTDHGSRVVRDRLHSLGFPFGEHSAQVEWAKTALANGMIERTSQAEQLARGRAISVIASATGMSELRVFHHLSRWPGAATAAYDEWRLIDTEESWTPDTDGTSV